MIASGRNKQQISSWLCHKIAATILLSFISCHPCTNTTSADKAFDATLQEVLIVDTLHFSRLSFKINIDNKSGHAEKLIFEKKASHDAPSTVASFSEKKASVMLSNPYNTNLTELRLSDTYPNELLILDGKTTQLSFVLEGNNTITTYFGLHPSDRSGVALEEMLKNTRLFLRYYDAGGAADSIEVKMLPSFRIRQ